MTDIVTAYTVMANVGMADIAIASIIMAGIVMANTVMAYVGMARIVMVYVVMTYTVIVPVVVPMPQSGNLRSGKPSIQERRRLSPLHQSPHSRHPPYKPVQHAHNRHTCRHAWRRGCSEEGL